MRAVIQRVLQASVQVEGKSIGQIAHGLLVLLGIEHADTADDCIWLANKIAKLRIFADENGNMNRSIQETHGEILLISQFTLHAKTKKGNRPSFIEAAPPEQAIPLYEKMKIELIQLLQKPLQCGEFGADMKVSLINDGPVTICIDTKNKE
jgi:D-tyrosyl-tRNA(Tyr) deacylase